MLEAAQRAQLDHARPGVTAESVDAIGRRIIADAGFGDLFIHRTGHGIGQETHEEPYIVEGNDKKRARLNVIAHLLSLIPYEEVPHEPVVLPERVFDPNYERRTLPPELYVPERY